MLRHLRNILCGLSLLLFLALFITWCFARRQPIGVWHKSSKSDLYQEFITSWQYTFITIHHNQIEMGRWQDPRFISQIKQSISLEAAPAEHVEFMRRVGLAPGAIHKDFSDSTRFFLPDGTNNGANPRFPWPRSHLVSSRNFHPEGK